METIDVMQTLRALYFGNVGDNVAAAVRRAYKDFCRTLSFDNIPEDERKQLRELVKEEIFEKKLNELDCKTQKAFDDWHDDFCNRLIEKYGNEGICFTYGQAQKWINMTMKYLILLDYDKAMKHFKFCHIPVDRYILTAAREKLDICPDTNVCWSQWGQESYLSFQKRIRGALTCSPLKWEAQAWIDTRNRGEKNKN